jgi:hypothetical protein
VRNYLQQQREYFLKFVVRIVVMILYHFKMNLTFPQKPRNLVAILDIRVEYNNTKDTEQECFV